MNPYTELDIPVDASLTIKQRVQVCELMLEILKDYEYGLRNLIFEAPPTE